MKYFVESNWEEWVPIPEIGINDHRRLTLTGADEITRAAIDAAEGRGLFSLEPNENDYANRNPDGTSTLGFCQTDKEKAQEWVDWRSKNLSPGQINCALIEVLEPGDPGYVAP